MAGWAALVAARQVDAQKLIGEPPGRIPPAAELLNSAEFEAVAERKLDAVYVPLAVKPTDLATALRALPALSFAGVNLTVPHKEVALGLVDEIGDLERAIEIAAEMAGVPARAAPVRLRRPFLGRLLDRFATRLASSMIDELETRISERYRT